MRYKILTKTVRENAIVTRVEFDIDGVIVTEDVTHFQPADAAAVRQGIVNRAMSEETKLNAATRNEQIVTELELDTPVEIPR